ncbi:MAG: hypothetical protein V4819_06075 [Verrucomicrobiota bacterium]
MPGDRALTTNRRHVAVFSFIGQPGSRLSGGKRHRYPELPAG